ncbi:adenosylcobinamide-phosphate synthase CbiB [Cellulosilyticum sp. I15G10I2]|uniref:adenosylcobinamide-phosphate synthase CbiB n=1 Tax=Cellulosilyticum sp. I15G10I2 TaxID=1892843 RepID=UPI00085C7D38|nr:adenosylcobinamide-phosphate synthase CbiB [Cellulosilyticum sp. I15G10I2]
MHLLIIILAYILDLVFGDPYAFPHPVRFIGKLTRLVEKQVRKHMKKGLSLKIGGGILWLVVVGTTYFMVYGIVKVSQGQPLIYITTNTLLIYTTLATKCLKDEAVKIYQTLCTGSLEASRMQLSFIVGRDTTELSEKEIIRATVETVAENTVDGIIAPLLYAFIGGAPLAFAYKAINTLDSMVGYKNEKYKDIGFVSAKMDDVANFIPARITSILMMLASFLLGLDARASIKIAIRDRKNHKSPNCAYPEGSVAGALGVQLGGTNTYFGEVMHKPTIGDARRAIENEDILRTNKLMYGTSLVALVVFSLGYYLISLIV